MKTTTDIGVSRTRRARVAFFTLAAGAAAADLLAKLWAQNSLAERTIDSGLIDLQLAYNSGVAFSLGNALPGWVVIACTTAITVGIAVLGWRIAPRAGFLELGGLAAVLGGATANLIDRTLNGHVTDYLHTGWWPTFNLADVLIVGGGITFGFGYLWVGRKGDIDPVRTPPS